MRLKPILTLALAAMVLAVTCMGSASAATWNYQTDRTTVYDDSTHSWDSSITWQGTAYVGQKLSWQNGLNNYDYYGAVYPQIDWIERTRGYDESYSNRKETTITPGQAWAVINYSKYAVSTTGTNNITVSHSYYDVAGNPIVSSSSVNHRYIA